jgi:hypothetical protein
MRALLVVALLGATVAAEPLPSGSLGVMFGAVSGTGADAKHVGFGYYQFGAQAQWQPMSTSRRIGWALRWSFVFGTLYEGDAAKIDDRLRTLQMDALIGLRFRPGDSPQRYLTVRAGPELFRANEQIPPYNVRAFVGGVATIGVEQYIKGSILLDFDVHYGLIGNGPAEIGLLIGAAIVGP